jgi:hypothetical protein
MTLAANLIERAWAHAIRQGRTRARYPRIFIDK